MLASLKQFAIIATTTTQIEDKKMLKNLEFASESELNQLLKMAIGRAFRMASLGKEREALKAASDAKEIKQALNDLEEMGCPILSVTTSIVGRSRVSDKELSTVWGQN